VLTPQVCTGRIQKYHTCDSLSTKAQSTLAADKDNYDQKKTKLGNTQIGKP
jgi:hypothetical protein